MVGHIEVWLGTKVVESALGMLALYMYFNGTGIWGGENMCMDNRAEYVWYTYNLQ